MCYEIDNYEVIQLTVLSLGSTVLWILGASDNITTARDPLLLRFRLRLRSNRIRVFLVSAHLLRSVVVQLLHPESTLVVNITYHVHVHCRLGL
jgi:hypothetical protein